MKSLTPRNRACALKKSVPVEKSGSADFAHSAMRCRRVTGAMKKQPEVTARTRQKLVDSFWELAEGKPLFKISVGEITVRAGYNRSTFYEYFTGLDDLLAYVEGELLEDAKQAVRAVPLENKSMSGFFQAVFSVTSKKVYLLIGPKGDPGFLPRMRSELFPLIAPYFPIPKDTPHFDYLASFAESTIFGILQHWSDRGRDLDAEEIGAMISNLVLHGVLGYVTTA